MFDIFSQFATDPKLELEGRWATIGAPSDSTNPDSAPAILVARTGNKRHGRIVSKLYEANRSVLESKGDEADAKGEEITISSMAQGILLGWKNLSFKGEALPDGWDIDTAKMLLGVKDFRALVVKHAETFSEYKLIQEDVDAKNSQSSSNGT